uniref:Prepilin leader peptidase/N-methyltransferase n=1 Tax=Desulfobacca acetoxidans TaxID=60893 RepID=A0A7V4G7W2_9BACT
MTGSLFAALGGLAVGRLLNLAVTDLAGDAARGTGQGLCPAGHGPLAWWDQMPLVNFFGRRGRCPRCGASFPWRYPLLEAAAAGLAGALWAKFPASPLLLAYFPLAALLLMLTTLDLMHQWLPDLLTLPGIALGLWLALTLPQLSFFQALGGALAGWAVFAGVRRLYGFLCRGKVPNPDLPHGLGGGDVKLLALIGAFLGIAALPLVLLITAVSGGLAGLVVLMRRPQGGSTSFPYGPFLALAAIFWLLVKA